MILKYTKLENYKDLPELVGGYRVRIRAAVEKEKQIIVKSMEVKLIPTGIIVEVPLGCKINITTDMEKLKQCGLETITSNITPDDDRVELEVGVRNIDKTDLIICFGDVLGNLSISEATTMILTTN